MPIIPPRGGGGTGIPPGGGGIIGMLPGGGRGLPGIIEGMLPARVVSCEFARAIL